MSKHLALLLVLAIFIAGCGQSYIERTEQLSKRVKSVVNPDELQAWATNAIANIAAKHGDFSVNPKATGIPKGMLGFSDDPPDVFVSSDGSCVVVCYGDFLDHMGLYVGDKSFKAESNQQLYVVAWQPGIYFWHQL